MVGQRLLITQVDGEPDQYLALEGKTLEQITVMVVQGTPMALEAVEVLVEEPLGPVQQESL